MPNGQRGFYAFGRTGGDAVVQNAARLLQNQSRPRSPLARSELLHFAERARGYHGRPVIAHRLSFTVDEMMVARQVEN